MTERDYLDRQEARAREALNSSARRVESELSQVVPLERIVRDHPLLSLGAGAAGGVAAGYLLGTVLGPRAARAVLGALGVAARPALSRLKTTVIDELVGKTDTTDAAR